VDAPAAVLVEVDVALRVHRDAVDLVELTGEAARTAEAAEALARRALDDLDLRVVLV
jgi:hypothetical protein